VLAVILLQAFAEDETFTIMLHSKDYLAHHPTEGFLSHHHMDEDIPLLLQLDEEVVMKNIVPAHCAPEVKFENEVDSATEFLQLKAALTPAIPLNPTTFDMNTMLPMAAGAYFLMNGGLNSVSEAMKMSGLGMKDVATAMPVLLSLASSVGGGGGGQGGSPLGSMGQMLPMLLPMLTGGGGGGNGGGMGQMMAMAPQLMQMMGGGGGGGGGGNGMGQLMSMAPQLMQMMGGGGGAGGGGGDMSQMMQMAPQLMQMMGGGGGGGGNGMGQMMQMAPQLMQMMGGGGGM
jgi:hypothetical protein